MSSSSSPVVKESNKSLHNAAASAASGNSFLAKVFIILVVLVTAGIIGYFVYTAVTTTSDGRGRGANGGLIRNILMLNLLSDTSAESEIPSGCNNSLQTHSNFQFSESAQSLFQQNVFGGASDFFDYRTLRYTNKTSSNKLIKYYYQISARNIQFISFSSGTPPVNLEIDGLVSCAKLVVPTSIGESTIGIRGSKSNSGKQEEENYVLTSLFIVDVAPGNSIDMNFCPRFMEDAQTVNQTIRYRIDVTQLIIDIVEIY